jgi:hypothetical protein
MKRLNACQSLYIGGPISMGGTLPESEVVANLAKFTLVAKHLQLLGFAVFNPATLPKYNRLGAPASQADYLEQCIWMVMRAEGMVCLDGWEHSPGARLEGLVMQRIGRPLFDERYQPIEYELIVRSTERSEQ